MPAFFDDAFTEASSDTELSLHTPGTGTSWTRLWSDNAHPRLSAIAATDRCKCSTTGNDSGVVYTADATYPSANYEVQVTWTGGSAFSTRPLYLIARLQDIENMYALRLANVASGVQLYKKVSGTWSTLGSALTIATGSVIKLSVNGTAIKVYDDGVEVISVTDSAISAAGKAGLAVGGGAELVASTDDANGSCEWDSFSATNLSSGLSATVNQSTETDLAQAIAKVKTKAVAQISEMDLAQAIAKIKQLALAQISETDLAHAITARKVLAIGQVSETDAAQAISYVPAQTVVAVGQASEMDSAQALTTRKIVAVAQVVETDAAQAISVAKARAVGQAAESDEAQGLSSRKIRSLAQVNETDAAQAITSLNGTLVNPVEETDLAQAITSRKVREIGQVVESDAAQGMTVRRVMVISQVTETDLAQALFPQKRVAVAQVLESDLAQVLGSRKVRALGQVSELDAALSMELAGAMFLGIAYLSTSLVDTAALSDSVPWRAVLSDAAYESATVEDEPL